MFDKPTADDYLKGKGLDNLPSLRYNLSCIKQKGGLAMFTLECVSDKDPNIRSFCLTDCGPSEGCNPDDYCSPDDSCKPD